MFYWGQNWPVQEGGPPGARLATLGLVVCFSINVFSLGALSEGILFILGSLVWGEHAWYSFWHSWCDPAHWCHPPWCWPDHSHSTQGALRLSAHSWTKASLAGVPGWDSGMQAVNCESVQFLKDHVICISCAPSSPSRNICHNSNECTAQINYSICVRLQYNYKVIISSLINLYE